MRRDNLEVKKAVKVTIWKRTFDLLFSIFLLPLVLPVIAVVASLIKLFEGGDVFFKQERLGLRGKCFFIYKFRTMHPNNAEILNEYLQKNKKALEEWITYRKLKGYDPRVTRLGRFLRKYSLDELPQIFNVLKGDMSFVGPRPYIPEELDETVPSSVKSRLLSVKPGITGLWQVEGRNDLDFRKRIELDLKYVNEMSFWNDLKILFKAFIVILKGKGAY